MLSGIPDENADDQVHAEPDPHAESDAASDAEIMKNLKLRGAPAEGSESTRGGNIDDAIEPPPFLDVKADYESVMQAILELKPWDIIEWIINDELNQHIRACGAIRERQEVVLDGAVVIVENVTSSCTKNQLALNTFKHGAERLFKLHLCSEKDCKVEFPEHQPRWLCVTRWRVRSAHDLGCQDQWIKDSLANGPLPDPEDIERHRVIAAIKAKAKLDPKHPSYRAGNEQGQGRSTTRQMSKVEDHKSTQSQGTPGTKRVTSTSSQPNSGRRNDGKRLQWSLDASSRSILAKLDVRTSTTDRHALQQWTVLVQDVVKLMHRGQLKDAQDKIDSFPVHDLPQTAQDKIKEGRSELITLQIEKGKIKEALLVRTCLQQIQ